MYKIPLTPFYFVRHGETDWNKKGIYMGNKDIPLNEMGRTQANLLYQILKDRQINHIACSPLSRALETAQIFNIQPGLPITIVDELKECNFGIAEGTLYNNNNFLEEWRAKKLHGSESAQEFEERVMIGLQKSLKLSLNVLIISHGFVYITISNIMNWPLLDLKNCEPILHFPPSSFQNSWNIHSLI